MATILGEQIQVFLSGKTLGCATSCSINISSDSIDVSCKDTAGFNATIPGKVTWQITSNNLFVMTDYKMLVDAMLNKDVLDVVFSTVANFSAATTPDDEGHVVPSGGWTPENDLYYGKVTISSVELTADNGAASTYSVTFDGHGALAKSNG